MTCLAPRQQQVLRLAARGMPNKAIAADLGLSEQTVKNQMRDAYARLGVDNRVDALVASGMLRAPDECGEVMRCTRPSGHPGHHGGFRHVMVPA